jgi:hypothetical protein
LEEEGFRVRLFPLAFALVSAMNWSAGLLEAAEPTASSIAPDASEVVRNRPKPNESELRTLIESLGSEEYQIREAAAEKLSRCDASILKKLRDAGSASTDPEIRARCLSIAQAIFEIDIENRTRAFLFSTDSNDDYGFKTWRSFSAIVGNDRLMKRIFVDFVKAFPDLCEIDLSDKLQLNSVYTSVATTIGKRRRIGLINEFDSIALQFCAIELGSVPADFERLTIELARSAPFSTLLSTGVYSRGLSLLVARWAESTIHHSDAVLQLILEKSIASAVPMARKVLMKQKELMEPVEFEMAVACLIRFGSQEDLKLLQRWTDDERVHSRNQTSRMRLAPVAKFNGTVPDGYPDQVFSGALVEVQVRYQDIAIAGWLMLSKQENIREFFPYLQEHYFRAFIVESLGFTDDEKEGHSDMIERWIKLSKSVGN